MSVDTAFDINGSGPDVVLVHGLGLNHNMWQWQLAALTPHFRVLSYDLLGHGESVKPLGPYTMDRMTRQLLDLLNESEIRRAAVIGFSLGGLIAQAFAVKHPERISALVILNSAHARSNADREKIMQRVRQAEESGPDATVDDALRRWFTDEFASNNPGILAQVRTWVAANDPNVYPEVYRLLATADIELKDSIASISCPTLVITGEQDLGNSPQMARNMAKKIPNANVEILPKLRHMALAESPDHVNTVLLTFLQTVLGTSRNRESA